MNALCMLVSHPRWIVAWEALASALNHIPVDRLYLAVSPKWKDRKWDDHLRKRIPGRIKTTFLPGTDRWQDVARVRFETFDRAAADGCDWLISVDDDDGVLGCPRLDKLKPEIGAWHTGVLAIYQEGIKDDDMVRLVYLCAYPYWLVIDPQEGGYRGSSSFSPKGGKGLGVLTIQE